VCSWTPRRWATSLLCSPSAQSRTIRHRSDKERGAKCRILQEQTPD
jgi:hypothetical protein